MLKLTRREQAGKVGSHLRAASAVFAPRVPAVLQTASTDCGVCCLAMLLRHHGRTVSVEELRNATGVGRDGTTMLSLVDTARLYGMAADGVKVEGGALASLPVPAIVHWHPTHFVVLERFGTYQVRIVDPLVGRVQIPTQRFLRLFTGAAVVVTPGDKPSPGPPRARGAGASFPDGGVAPWEAAVSLAATLSALAVCAAAMSAVEWAEDVAPGALWPIVLVVLAAACFLGLASYLRNVRLIRSAAGSREAWSERILAHLMELPVGFAQRQRSDELVSSAEEGGHAAERRVEVIAARLDLLFASGFVGLLLTRSPAMAALVAIAATAFTLPALLASRLTPGAQQIHVSAPRLRGFAAATLGRMGVVKVRGLEEMVLRRWRWMYAPYRRALGAARRWKLALQLFARSAALLGTAGVFGAAALMLESGTISAAVLAGTLLASLHLTWVMESFVAAESAWVAQRGRVRYVRELFEVDVASATADDARHVDLSGAVSADHISHRYAGNAPLVLRDISLRIESGEFVVITGRGACGKSTLISILLGLIPQTAGDVLYDGFDLRRESARPLRRQIGAVLQDPGLVSGPIAENILFGFPEASQAELIRVCTLAGIRGEIDAMPLRYKTPVQAGGENLSRSQIQRIAIARALVGSPRVLFLDDAMSSFDAATAEEIARNLASLDCTIIAVGHQPSLMERADRVFVIEDGRLAEAEADVRRGRTFGGAAPRAASGRTGAGT